MSQRSLISTIILLTPFVFCFAFAMDIYIPVVPEIKQYFHTTQGMIQLTLSLFMFAAGAGQLVLGPITDQYGRKPVLLCAIISFMIGSLCCALAPNLSVLMLGRLIQSLGGCGMLVATFACVRDQFSGKDSAKVYSFLNCGIAISPLFAPIIGSYLGAWFNWRAEFIFLVLLSLPIFLIGLTQIQESLPKEKRIRFDIHIFQRYGQILTNRTFYTYVICTTAGMTLFFVFFSSSPYIIIKLLHVPVTHFGYYFFLVGFTFFIGSLISGKVAHFWGAYYTTLFGTALMLVAGVLMVGWFLLTGLNSLQYLIPSMLAGIAGAFMMGAGVSGAMEPFGVMAGTAAALNGCLQLAVSALIGSWVMHWPVTSTNPFALTIIISSCVGLIALWRL
ncbi:MAG: multidrug effflux MFS transporter [Gammaproteobacteria bacterium]